MPGQKTPTLSGRGTKDRGKKGVDHWDETLSGFSGDSHFQAACKNCGRMIPRSANNCPHCGRSAPTGSRALVNWIGGMIAIFAVVFALPAVFPPLEKEGAEKRPKSVLAVPAVREISPPTWATGGKVRIERRWEKGKLLIVEVSLNTEARGIQTDVVVHC